MDITEYKVFIVLFCLIVSNQELHIEAAKPVLDNRYPIITIPEDTAFGVKIYQCNATDADDSNTLAGQIRYGRLKPKSKAAEKFLLDTKTCEYYVNTKLDFETKTEYRLKFTAKDLGSPANTVTGMFTIRITDINDHTPTCTESFKVAGSVNEDEIVGSQVTSLDCGDDDVGTLDGQLAYKLSDSNDAETKDKFRMTLNDGKLNIKELLDYESRTAYEVSIDVYDLGSPSLSTTVIVYVDINDVDDNKPTWSTNPILQTVIETTPLDTAVFVVAATDVDAPNTPASTIKYEIKTKGNPDWFDIDRETGAVSVKGIMNYAIAPWVTMDVLAYSSDKSSDFNVVTINITLTDENNLAPTFEKFPYEANITENSPTNTFIVNVHAIDPEMGVNGEVEYYMTSIDFSVDIVSGDVTLNSNVNFESVNVYSIQIEARDKGATILTGYSFLLINILPENEYDPVITGPSSAVDVQEDVDPGYIVYTFTESDDDDGFDGMVTFSILDPLDPFTIEPTNGILRVGRPLDRDDIHSQWEVVVIATDSSEANPRSSSTTITITLLDVNDNNPICDPIPNSVVTLPTPITTVLATVSCADNDIGLNADLVYTKLSGDDLNSFSVDASSGEITLAQKPTKVGYQITIAVEDKGNPILNTTVQFNVIAELQFTLNNLPKSVHFTENTKLSFELFDVDDCCVFSLTQYEITSGNEDNHVIIHPSSGKLILMNSFDRETKDNFRYNIRATAIDTNTTADSYIDIIIDDVNDNAPRFNTNFQYISVSETLPVSTTIIQFVATDLDIGTNSDLEYSILVGNDDAVFEIDSVGNLKLSLQPDAEVTPLYSLVIAASDKGIVPLIGSTTIDIEVINVNEFNPELVNVINGTVSTNVSEDATLGAPIFSLQASDKDNNTAFTYVIIQGNAEGTFVIDSSGGDIYLAKLLDRERTAQYNLTVEVNTEDNDTVSAIVVIDVLDINDNDPKFSQYIYQLQVTHEDPPNSPIKTFLITDKDIDSNKDIVSLIITSGDTNNHFKIVGNEIQTNIQIDYYDRDQYTLTLKATDGGDTSRSGYAQIIIKVLPKFRPPLFPANDYSTTIPEDTTPGDAVFNINATADGGTEGDLGTLEYSIRSGNEDKKFYISEFTGIIHVASTLDFETVEQYTFIIDALSREDSTLSASATVSIDIDNVNDNTPIFGSTVYEMYVDEDADSGDDVATVAATDLDKTPFGTITFSFGVSTGSTDFNIDSTGLIEVMLPLDYLRQNIYNIPVIANDGVKQGESLVVIRINDVNNNQPIFTPNNVNIEVIESLGTGLTFYSADASDLDTGIMGQIKYTLVSGNNNNLLGLDTDSGALTVVSSLDRETHNRFDLVIRAEDQTVTGRLSGTLYLTVNVADVNDEDPSFPQTLVDATINRVDVPGTHVWTVAATDDDAGDNAVIVYEISGGNTDGLFLIGVNSGEIKTASSVTTAENEYNLEITARDKGVPARSGTMTVKVQIIPIKVFGPSEQSMQIFEGLPAVTPLTNVTPKTGHSPSATITFTINGGNFKTSFKIDANSGLISTLRVLDREEYPFYILSINVSDNNGVSYSKTVSVTVYDINDNDPIITTTDTNINVVENTPAGQPLAGFAISDYDAGDASVVDLSLSPGPADEYLELSGQRLKLKKSFDYETVTYVTATVLAIDRGSPKRTASVIITVNVVDVDDAIQYINGPPELPSIYISREASYNSGNGDKATSITAEDFGKDSNIGQTTFTSLNREGIFIIDSTGTVTVNKAHLLEPLVTYFVWIVATTETADDKSSVLGLLRIDTFDPNLHLVSLESLSDVTTLEANRDTIISSLTNFFLPTEVPRIWKIQSYNVNRRRKLLAAGSQTLVYVLEDFSADIADIETPKKFKDMIDILNALRMVSNQVDPQPSLPRPNYPIVAVNGHSEDLLPREPPITDRSGVTEPTDTFVSSTEGYITFGLLALLFLLIILALIFLYRYKKKKRERERNGSSENLVYTDPNTNVTRLAITIPKGLGKKKTDLPTNKTTRRSSLGPASTALPTKPVGKKKSVVATPESESNGITPVQTTAPVKPATPNTFKTKAPAKSPTPIPTVTTPPEKPSTPNPVKTKSNLPPPRTAIKTTTKVSTDAETPATPKDKNAQVVHHGKSYDGVGYDNGKKYAYNTKTGSTLWMEKDNALGNNTKTNKTKVAPKLTVVSEASASASPNISANRQ